MMNRGRIPLAVVWLFTASCSSYIDPGEVPDGGDDADQPQGEPCNGIVCSPGEDCIHGRCVAVVDGDGDGDSDGDGGRDADEGDCFPDCEGRVCGSDGCDGECEPGCAVDEACLPSTGQCAPRLWVPVDPGTFMMGSPDGERGRFGNEDLHEVTLTHAFFIRAVEVTQAEFYAVMGSNPSTFDDCGPNCPVERVTWHEAAYYCNSLSLEAELDPCYICVFDQDHPCDLDPNYATPYECPGYRLPTEAEWEYTARAGDQRATPNGEIDETGCNSDIVDPIAWYCGNNDARTQEVATKTPNAWGIHGMFGNVFEWCHDRWGDYPSYPVTDPFGPIDGHERATRAGPWGILARYARAARRVQRYDNGRHFALGFRVVITAD